MSAIPGTYWVEELVGLVKVPEPFEVDQLYELTDPEEVALNKTFKPAQAVLGI